MPLSQPIHLVYPKFEQQNGFHHHPENTVNDLETESNSNIKWGSLTNYAKIKKGNDAAYNELVKGEPHTKKKFF